MTTQKAPGRTGKDDKNQRRYAEGTRTTVDASRAELEQLLRRYGASGFNYAWIDVPQRAEAVAFQLDGRIFRFGLRLPDEHDAAAIMEAGIAAARRAHTARPRTVAEALEAERRRLWRALVESIRGRLVSVADGIETLEEAFLAHEVTPSGATVGQWLIPQLADVYERGTVPPLLPGVTGTDLARKP